MAFQNDKVVRAEKYERPMQGRLGAVFDHVGVVVHTDKGQSFLIHNTPESGVVATPAENMSSKWDETRDIEVRGHKTVGGAIKAGGYTSGSCKLDEYVDSGLCIGTVKDIIKYLEN